MLRKIIAIAVAAGIGSGIFAACDPHGATTIPAAAATTTADAVQPENFAPVVNTPAPTMAPAVAADPYSTDGEWLVPSQIAPGTYKAIPKSASFEGYIEVCSDMECAIGSGLIHNYLVDGPQYFTIPANAVKVHLEGVTIQPQG